MGKPEWTGVVDRARAGDVDAQHALLTQFTPLVRATAARLVPHDDVDDVAQETFAVAIAELANLRTSEAFPAWLRLIVRKQAHRHRQRVVEIVDLDGVEPVGSAADPADLAVRRDVAAVVRVALAGARDPDRRLLELRYLAGWSNAELAEHLGVAPGTLRKRLHDARRRLRPNLEAVNPKEPRMIDPTRFLGGVHGPDVAVPDPPSLRRPPDERTVTGLKVVDAIAPVRRGGTIEMSGPHGTGQVVVALELLFRLGRNPNDIACVAVGLAGAPIGSQSDLGHVVTEPGVPAAATAILYTEREQADAAVDGGSRIAAGLAGAGRDVVLLIDGATTDRIDRATLTNAAGLAGQGSVTVVALRPVPRGDAPPSPLGLDTTLVFSIEQFALGIFPAVDPMASTSVLPASGAAATVRAQLAHAATVRSWFHQDLFVAADVTGRDGTWIEPNDADEELHALVR